MNGNGEQLGLDGVRRAMHGDGPQRPVLQDVPRREPDQARDAELALGVEEDHARDDGRVEPYRARQREPGAQPPGRLVPLALQRQAQHATAQHEEHIHGDLAVGRDQEQLGQGVAHRVHRLQRLVEHAGDQGEIVVKDAVIHDHGGGGGTAQPVERAGAAGAARVR